MDQFCVSVNVMKSYHLQNVLVCLCALSSKKEKSAIHTQIQRQKDSHPNDCHKINIAQLAINAFILLCFSVLGVLAESRNTTTWCCLVEENPVPVTSGTNVLYRRKDARPQCEFGYDPESNCSECVQGEGQLWSGLARFVGNFNQEINFLFTFGGVNCSSVRGKQL